MLVLVIELYEYVIFGVGGNVNMDLAYNKEWKILVVGALCYRILFLNCYTDSSI